MRYLNAAARPVMQGWTRLNNVQPTMTRKMLSMELRIASQMRLCAGSLMMPPRELHIVQMRLRPLATTRWPSIGPLKQPRPTRRARTTPHGLLPAIAASTVLQSAGLVGPAAVSHAALLVTRIAPAHATQAWTHQTVAAARTTADLRSYQQTCLVVVITIAKQL